MDAPREVLLTNPSRYIADCYEFLKKPIVPEEPIASGVEEKVENAEKITSEDFEKAAQSLRIQRGVAIAFLCLGAVALASLAVYAFVPLATIGITLLITTFVVATVSAGIVFPLVYKFGWQAAQLNIDLLFGRLLGKGSLTDKDLELFARYGYLCHNLDSGKELVLGVTLEAFFKWGEANDFSMFSSMNVLKQSDLGSDFPKQDLTQRQKEAVKQVMDNLFLTTKYNQNARRKIDLRTLNIIRQAIYRSVLVQGAMEKEAQKVKKLLLGVKDNVITPRQIFTIIACCPNLKRIQQGIIDDRWFRGPFDSDDHAVKNAISVEIFMENNRNRALISLIPDKSIIPLDKREIETFTDRRPYNSCKELFPGLYWRSLIGDGHDSFPFEDEPGARLF